MTVSLRDMDHNSQEYQDCKGSIVAAGAVIVRDMEFCVIVGGIPAKVNRSGKPRDEADD